MDARAGSAAGGGREEGEGGAAADGATFRTDDDPRNTS